MFIAAFEQILNWFNRQTIMHFYSSSLLLVYEGNSKISLKVAVRMIDFSHAIEIDEMKGNDENYIFGISKLVEMFKSLSSNMHSYKHTQDSSEEKR